MSRMLLLLPLVAFLCFYSCGISENDYSEFHNLPESGWAYGDSLRFNPCIGDSAAIGSLIVSVRHSNIYPYSNLWLEVTRLDSHGKIARDTVNMLLSDRYGRWLGNGFGAEYQFSDTIPGATCIVRDSAVIVRHVMRVDNLTGIEQLGVTFVSSKR